jgi:hypothetical protein
MKEKKEKVFKGMTAPVDVHLDIPDEEIWTYKIDGLAEPHINKPFTNFTAKKIVFTVLLVIAVLISMYFSVRVVSRVPFEYNAVGDGTYEFTKFNNTGYIGHLKAVKYSTLMATNPEEAVRLAVKGMIPNNSIGRDALTRLRIYKGSEHKHEAQQPTVWEM